MERIINQALDLAPTEPRTDPATLADILRCLSAILTDDEVGAIRPLVAQHGRQPEGLLRYQGALYIRYFLSFWQISDGRLEVYREMFPNGALFEGVEKLEIEAE